jgi:hypothetical protein
MRWPRKHPLCTYILSHPPPSLSFSPLFLDTRYSLTSSAPFDPVACAARGCFTCPFALPFAGGASFSPPRTEDSRYEKVRAVTYRLSYVFLLLQYLLVTCIPGISVDHRVGSYITTGGQTDQKGGFTARRPSASHLLRTRHSLRRCKRPWRNVAVHILYTTTPTTYLILTTSRQHSTQTRAKPIGVECTSLL